MSVKEAIWHLQEGRIEKAEAILRLLASGSDPDAMHLLGMLRDRAGDVEGAEVLVRKAIRAAPRTAGFHTSLGTILAKKGEAKGAVEATARAVELDPSVAAFHHNHGLALSRNEDVDGAIAAYKKAIAIDPSLARSHECLGHLLSLKREDADALAELFVAIDLDAAAGTASTDTHFGVAAILTRRDEFAEAAKHLRSGLAIDPDHLPSLILLSRYSTTLGDEEPARELAEHAVRIAPRSFEANIALGDALSLTSSEQAKRVYAAAHELKPEDPTSLLSAATLVYSEGNRILASTQFESAYAAYPNHPVVLEAWAQVLHLEGDADRALELARRSVELEPGRLSSRALLLKLQYLDKATPRAERFESAKEWHRVASLTHPQMPPARPDRDPDRPLRIGYVGGTFSNDALGYMMQPLFAKHSSAVDVFLYANQFDDDANTALFRGSGHHWRSVPRLSHPDLARLIREERIDILVDLAGFTSGHRLEVFVRKPAPIQVTWNWIATTGISAIDYTFVDDVVMSPEEQQWWVEKPWFLPGCYVPIPRLRIPTMVNPLPRDQKGYITFGCLNGLSKMTNEVIELWARILRRIPSARLALVNDALKSPKVALHVRARFAKHGIDRQLLLMGGLARNDFLRQYNAVDIALDPFPHNGGMTTLESLYMGVPVVALLGDPVGSRCGATMLTNAFDLPELVARDHDDYVAIAERLANDREALSMYRATLRSRIDRASNPAAFAEKLEAAYRGMWRKYLASSNDGV